VADLVAARRRRGGGGGGGGGGGDDDGGGGRTPSPAKMGARRAGKIMDGAEKEDAKDDAPRPRRLPSSLARIERITDDPLRRPATSTTATAATTESAPRRKERTTTPGGVENEDDDDHDGDLDDDDDGEEEEEEEDEWHTSLLLLMPLRLGIKSISASDYGSTLSKLVALPHSVGMLGGTPRHALWFYGADAAEAPPRRRGGGEGDDDDGAEEEDGDDRDDDGGGVGECGWYGLDPHVVQPAPRGSRVGAGGGPSDSAETTTDHRRWRVHLTDSYLRSLRAYSSSAGGPSHPNHERAIPLSSLDPSCALGFYVRDRSDFDAFRKSIESLSAGHCRPNGLPEIVTVAERTPNYELDVSSAIGGMIGRGGGGVGGIGVGIGGDKSRDAECSDGFSMQSDADREEDDDDDDFVLI
jgi:hypothetical protein